MIPIYKPNDGLCDYSKRWLGQLASQLQQTDCHVRWLIAGIITKEDAKQILLDTMDILSEDDEIQIIGLYKDAISGDYMWSASFSNGYGSINASTGKIRICRSVLDSYSLESGNIDFAETKAMVGIFGILDIDTHWSRDIVI